MGSRAATKRAMGGAVVEAPPRNTVRAPPSPLSPRLPPRHRALARQLLERGGLRVGCGGGRRQRGCPAARSRLLSSHLPAGVPAMREYLSTLFGSWFRLLAGRRQTRLLMVGLDGTFAARAGPAGKKRGGRGGGERGGGGCMTAGEPTVAADLCVSDGGGGGLTDTRWLVSVFRHWLLSVAASLSVSWWVRGAGEGAQGRARPPFCSSLSWASLSTPSLPLVRWPCPCRGSVRRLVDSCLGCQLPLHWGRGLLLPRGTRSWTRKADGRDGGAPACARTGSR